MGAGATLLVEVTNRQALARRFGEVLAGAVDRELGDRARQLWGDDAQVHGVGDGRLVVFWPDDGMPFGRTAELCEATDAMLLQLSARHAPCSHVAWLAQLRGTWIDADSVAEARAVAQDVVYASAMKVTDDLRLAGRVLHAMAADSFTLVLDPVCDPEDPSRVLYQDCAVWLRDAGDNVATAAEFVPGLEMVDLAPCYDSYVVRRMIGLLRRSPSLELGVRVSGQSLAHSPEWEATLDGLRGAPHIARRLVIEVAADATLDRGSARPFVNTLRQLGCRVALGDYGTTYGVDTGIEIPEPDIVRIDASFMAAARGSRTARRRLAVLLKLASAVAPVVIVTGVENEADRAIARDAGARWVQPVASQQRAVLGPRTQVAEAGDTATGPAQSEDVVALVQDCMHELADSLFDEVSRERVKAAFDAGLASGFFGSGSALATGMRGRYEELKSRKRGRARGATDGDAWLYELGMQQGARIRASVT